MKYDVSYRYSLHYVLFISKVFKKQANIYKHKDLFDLWLKEMLMMYGYSVVYFLFLEICNAIESLK